MESSKNSEAEQWKKAKWWQSQQCFDNSAKFQRKFIQIFVAVFASFTMPNKNVGIQYEDNIYERQSPNTVKVGCKEWLNKEKLGNIETFYLISK